MFNVLTTILLCTGISPSGDVKLEVEIRPEGKFSTIRYEYLKNWPGTSYKQTLGHFDRYFDGMNVEYVSTSASDPERATRLVAMVHGESIMGAKFTHMNSKMKNSPMKCRIKDGADNSHDGH